MKRMWLLGVALCALLMVGCGRASAIEPDAIPGDESVAPLEIVITPIVDDKDIPAAAWGAQQQLVMALGRPADEIRIVGVAPAQWPDGCLGLPPTDGACTAVILPGYLVLIEVDGDSYRFRTDQEGRQVALESGPAVTIDEPLVSWRSSDGMGCRAAEFDGETVAFGNCGGARLAGRYVLPERAADLTDFIARYAPFESETPAGGIRFAGQGQQVATDVEQRMIAEWARLAVDEAAAGRSGASWGLALAWHLENDTLCQDLTVDLTGAIYGSDCSQPEIRSLGRARLERDELEMLYPLIDQLQPFEYARIGMASANVTLSGRGPREATDQERDRALELGPYFYELLQSRGK